MSHLPEPPPMRRPIDLAPEGMDWREPMLFFCGGFMACAVVCFTVYAYWVAP